MGTVNFSQAIPKGFLELGYGSLENARNTELKPTEVNILNINTYDSFEDNEPEISTTLDSFIFNPIHLEPTFNEALVIALDTSSIVLGETKSGVLCSVRGCIVWKENGNYQYVRHGPFFYHITVNNHRWIYNKLRQTFFGSYKPVQAPSIWDMPGRIRNFLERWLQKQICQLSENALILLDGSLTAGTIDSPISVVNHLLRVARERGNIVLAFSKKTRLCAAGQKITDLVDDRYAPCVLNIDDVIRSQYRGQLRFLGRIYAVKLAPCCYTFRLDVDRQLSEDVSIDALRQLIGNDLVVESYPETLRLAHIFSSFTANEVIAMQRFVSDNFGLRIISRPDVRQVLYGPLAGSFTRTEGDRYAISL